MTNPGEMTDAELLLALEEARSRDLTLPTWEPVKPTYEQAQSAYQTLLELSRRHDDPELLYALRCARELLKHLFDERKKLL